ncbi:hypothetical protein [Nitrosomonas oligotropha]|uniref:hypothetical protein n=1 Tax=Nitrosomonas oligotropha TaxID=42354 RepID=UPI001368F42D|nr:hypothetical protein [Nitrosomonas oligotropha]MXS82239.1 hypothetical protein [Nitrosomonas oligotropha]
MKKQKRDIDTIDMFDELPPPPVTTPGGLSCRAEIAHVMSNALKEHDRYEVVAKMSRLLGADVRISYFNNYTAESREDAIPSLDVAIAFDLATGGSALAEFFARKIGAKLVFGKEALDAKLGRLERMRDEAAKEIKRIKKAMGEA